MEPEEQTQPDKNRFLMLGIASLVIIVAVITLIVVYARNRVEVTRQTATPQAVVQQGEPTESIISGKLGLQTKGQGATFRNGQTATLFVYADTRDQQITGYDAVLRYDPTQVRFESVKSLLDGMDVYETVEEIDENTSELIVTGVQGLSRDDPFVFENTALAEVSFTVLTSGAVDIDMVYEPGSDLESNLMTSRNQDILSDVDGISLNVR